MFGLFPNYFFVSIFVLFCLFVIAYTIYKPFLFSNKITIPLVFITALPFYKPNRPQAENYFSLRIGIITNWIWPKPFEISFIIFIVLALSVTTLTVVKKPL